VRKYRESSITDMKSGINFIHLKTAFENAMEFIRAKQNPLTSIFLNSVHQETLYKIMLHYKPSL